MKFLVIFTLDDITSFLQQMNILSYYVAPGSEITPCIKISLQILGNCYEIKLLTSCKWQNPNVFHAKNMVQNNFNVI